MIIFGCSKQRQMRKQLDLKGFMQRIKVLELYRDCLRAANKISSQNDKNYLKEWIRTDFKMYRNEENEEKIKTLLATGRSQLRTLLASVNLAKSNKK